MQVIDKAWSYDERRIDDATVQWPPTTGSDLADALDSLSGTADAVGTWTSKRIAPTSADRTGHRRGAGYEQRSGAQIPSCGGVVSCHTDTGDRVTTSVGD
jgi:hypothetical protein